MTAPRVVRLTLPLPPNRANARGHWARLKRQQDEYRLRVRVALQNQRAIPMRITEKSVRVTAVFYVWAKMDDDNCVARLKWPLDCLVFVGLLHDDKRPYCILSGIPEQVIDRKHPRVEIELTELQSPDA